MLILWDVVAIGGLMVVAWLVPMIAMVVVAAAAVPMSSGRWDDAYGALLCGGRRHCGWVYLYV